MSIRIITPHEQQVVQAWYAQAMQDPTVYPYLSMTPSIIQWEAKPDNWQSTIMMDSSNKGFAVVSPLRESMSHRFNLGLWVLNTPQRAWIAGKLFQRAEVMARRQGGKWLEWYVCEDNEHCLKFSRNHAMQFSAQPEAAWSWRDATWKASFGFMRKID